MWSNYWRTRRISLEERKTKETKQEAAIHKFFNNTIETESSEDEFQGLTLMQSNRVRSRKKDLVKDNERSQKSPQYEYIQLTIEVTNNAAATRQLEVERNTGRVRM